MPQLDDPREELFAQHLAAGAASQGKAYLAAGYAAATGSTLRANAARAAAKDCVRQRVSELQSAAAERFRAEQASAAADAGIDLQWLIHEGKKLFKACVDAEEFGAASQTYERLAKVAGVWVDRAASETNAVTRVYSATPLSETEWQDQYAPARPPGRH